MGLERINELKKQKGLTNAQLAKMTGLTISTLDKITSGYNTNPKLATVESICNAIGCTISDLLSENQKEEKRISFTSAETLHIKKYRTLDEYGKRVIDSTLDIEYERCTSVDEESEETPVFEIRNSVYKVSAGTGYQLDVEEWETIEIPDTYENRQADFALTISGNSMEPVYHDGDIVLVKAQQQIELGEIGIFIINDEGYIKKYGGNRLISLNDDYDDIVFSEGDYIKCCGKVIGRV